MKFDEMPPHEEYEKITTPEPMVRIEEIIPELSSLALETVRLHPHRGKTYINCSNLGGMILWPGDEKWPICNDHQQPFIPVLQVRKKDIPELEFPKGKDLFQLLWCPNFHDLNEYPKTLTLWRTEQKILDPLESYSTPEKRFNGYILKPCKIFPERVTEYPSAFEVSSELHDKIQASEKLQEVLASIIDYDFEDPSSLYQYCLSTAKGSKIGGYVDWIQDPEVPICKCGLEMTPLFTIASWEFDGASWVRWLPVEDRRRKKSIVQEPTGLMIGDAGSLFFFICRHCGDYPITFVMQYS